MLQEKVISYTEASRREIYEEMHQILQLEKEVAYRKNQLRPKMIEFGEGMEYGVKVQKVSVKGSVDYKALVNDIGIEKETIEEYRKPDSEYWKVSNY